MRKYSLFLFLLLWEVSAQAQTILTHYEGEDCALVDLKTKKPLTAYKYESIEAFQEGFAVATLRTGAGKRYTYLNEKGQELLPPTENQLFPFVNGRAIFRKKDKFGFLDKLGREVVPATYTKTNNYSCGLAVVQETEKKYTIINEVGEVVFELSYPFVEDKFQEDLLLVCLEGERTYKYDNRGHNIPAYKGAYTFLDKKGNTTLKVKDLMPEVERAESFQNGVARVYITKTYRGYEYDYVAYMDKKGKIITPFFRNIIAQDHLLYTSDAKPEKYRIYQGLYDMAGKEILPTTYKYLAPKVGKHHLMQKYLHVDDDSVAYYKHQIGAWGVLDSQFKETLPAQYLDMWHLKEGGFLAMLPTKFTKIIPRDEAMLHIIDTSFKYMYQRFDGAGKAQGDTLTFLNYPYYEENDNKTQSRKSELYPVLLDKKWAVADGLKRLILTDWADEIAPFTKARQVAEIALRYGKKWKLLNQNFDHAYSFGEADFTAVKKGKKWALIHLSGTEMTDYQYDSIAPLVQRVVFKSKIDVYVSRDDVRILGLPEDDNSQNEKTLEYLKTPYLPAQHFLACQNQKWGMIDAFGKIVTPFENEAIVDVFYDYLIVRRAGKEGVIDYAGKVLVDFQDGTFQIINDLAYLAHKNTVKLYTLDNQLIISGDYDAISPHPTKSDIFIIQKGRKMGWADATGKVLFQPIYVRIGVGSSSNRKLFKGERTTADFYMLYETDKKVGLANLQYEIIIPCEYEQVDAYNSIKDQIIFATKNEKQGAINFKNEVIIPFEYDKLTNLTPRMERRWEIRADTLLPKKENLKQGVIYAEKGDKTGIFNFAGKLIIPLMYDKIHLNTAEQKLIAISNNQHKVFDLEGKTLYEAAWDTLLEVDEYRFEDTFWVVKKGKKWGIVTPSGELKLPLTYQEIEMVEFYRDDIFFKVRKGKKWGVMDSNMQLVAPFEYEKIWANTDREFWGEKKGQTMQLPIKMAESPINEKPKMPVEEKIDDR